MKVSTKIWAWTHKSLNPYPTPRTNFTQNCKQYSNEFDKNQIPITLSVLNSLNSTKKKKKKKKTHTHISKIFPSWTNVQNKTRIKVNFKAKKKKKKIL